ncbi:MAG: HNH endonuclease [Oscillibacter sp.]|nr:HNH endonuclease [Oscillibacter sp.]
MREGYDYSSALAITGETLPCNMKKYGNNEIYTLSNGAKALMKFSKYYPDNKAYWYGITPGQVDLFSSEPIDYYFFITGYVGVLKVPAKLLQPYLVTCNVSQAKGHPDKIRHYHVMIQYVDGKVSFRKGPDITNYFFCDDESDGILEDDIKSQPIADILEDAKRFVDSPEAYVIVEGEKKIRKESRAQKYRIACIEDFTCQVCGFKESYMDKSGKIKYIYEVDHIKNKALGYGENINNLWVLCPNCHEKKTRGVITIDLDHKQVLERNKVIRIRDRHLFVDK